MADQETELQPVIELTSVTKRYGNTVAVNDVSLAINPGEVLALLGPSGCGKTTLLRSIAGFERPDAGTISIRGRVVSSPEKFVPPERRQIGFVFQDYALFPHLSVERNVGFGLRKMSRAQRSDRVTQMLQLVGLGDQDVKFPHQLSGGQQQRVALARALAPDPDVVLMDEPFSNLDAGLRRQVREDLRDILEKAKATAVFVTHDQEEALNLGARVAIMKSGELLEIGPARDVYLNPKSMQAAEIVGRVNVLEGESVGISVKCALGHLPLSRPCRTNGPVQILLRPEAIKVAPWYPNDRSRKPTLGTVEDLQFHGNHQHLCVRLPEGGSIRVRVGPEQVFQEGEKVSLTVPEPVIGFESPVADK